MWKPHTVEGTLGEDLRSFTHTCDILYILGFVMVGSENEIKFHTCVGVEQTTRVTGKTKRAVNCPVRGKPCASDLALLL